MKARVKATGEIVEIKDLYDDGTALVNDKYFKVSELDFFSEMLFPQETVFNRFGVAVTFLQWKVPKTGLCFEAVQRNGKWGCVTSFMASTHGYGHPLTRSDCVHDTLEQAVMHAWNKEVLHGFNMGKTNWETRARKEYSKWLESSDKISYFSVQNLFQEYD